MKSRLSKNLHVQPVIMKKLCNNGCLLLTLTMVLTLLGWDKSLSQVKLEWVKKLDSAKKSDGGNDIAVDSKGNVYATGFVQTAASLAVISTTKYDAAGNLKWIKYYRYTDDAYFKKSSSRGVKISFDNTYNIYVLGSSGPNLIDDDFYYQTTVVKYDSLGNEVWLSSTADEAIDMNVGKPGNVYTASERITHSGKTFTITAFNENGNGLWHREYEGSSSGYHNFNDRLKSLEADKVGNVYNGALVYLDPTVFSPNYGFSIAGYDAAGARRWDHWYQGDSINYFTIDDAGNLLTAGNFTSAEMLFMKLSKDGEILWKNNVSTTSGVSVLTVDQSRNIYTTGSSGDGLSIIKVNVEGAFQWEKFHVDTKNFRQVSKGLVVDDAGNIYVLVQSINSNDISDFVVIKYDSNGNQQWEQRYDGPAKDDDNPQAIAVDKFGNVFVTGASKGVETGYDFITIKYSQIEPSQFGVCCFDNGLGPQAKCGSNVTPLNCSKSGKDAFFAGSVSACSLIDTAAMCTRTPSIVHIDANYKENTHSIELTWERTTTNSITGYYVQRSSDGKSFKSIGFMPVNAAGNYIFTDPYPEVENYYKLVWFEKNGHESNQVLALVIQKDRMQLLPNPATNKVRVIVKDMEHHDSRLTVTDNTGIIKLSQRIAKGTRPELDVSNLSAGIYFIRVEQNGKVYRNRLVKQ